MNNQATMREIGGSGDVYAVRAEAIEGETSSEGRRLFCEL
jgi:hypothetical protein